MSHTVVTLLNFIIWDPFRYSRITKTILHRVISFFLFPYQTHFTAPSPSPLQTRCSMHLITAASVSPSQHPDAHLQPPSSTSSSSCKCSFCCHSGNTWAPSPPPASAHRHEKINNTPTQQQADVHQRRQSTCPWDYWEATSPPPPADPPCFIFISTRSKPHQRRSNRPLVFIFTSLLFPTAPALFPPLLLVPTTLLSAFAAVASLATIAARRGEEMEEEGGEGVKNREK